MIVALSIFMAVFAIGYAGSMAISTQRPSTPATVRVLDAPALEKKLATLEQRLRDAQKSIDEVLAKLATSNSEVDRARLDVLFRLESGLAADIARARGALQSVASARVDGAWQSHGKPSR